MQVCLKRMPEMHVKECVHKSFPIWGYRNLSTSSDVREIFHMDNLVELGQDAVGFDLVATHQWLTPSLVSRH